MVKCPNLNCGEEVNIEEIDEVDDLGIVDEDEESTYHEVLREYECLSCGCVFTATATKQEAKEENR